MQKVLAMLMALCLVFGSAAALAESTPEITVWIPVYQFGDGISDQDFWDGWFDAFEAENNCTVKVEIIPWGDYNTTIYTGLLNNDGPDVAYVTDTYDLVHNGLLLPLDDYLTQADKDNYIYWSVSSKDVEGKNYTIPMMVGNACVIFYNVDMFEKAGIDTFATDWDAFIDMCLEIKEANEGVYPILMAWGASSGTSACMTSFWPFYWQAGGEEVDENGVVSINNEAGLATLEFLYKLYEAGIFDDTITATDDPTARFTERQSAMVINGTGKNTSLTKAEINWDFVLNLSGSAGQATRIAVDSLAVSAKSEYPELAAKAAVYMTSGPVMDDFHQNIYAMPKITYDSEFVDNERFEELYSDMADKLHVTIEFEGKASFENILQQNIQLMYMGELTPQEVLDETMSYYLEQIKQ